MPVLQETTHKINIVGFNNHELTGLKIAAAAVVLPTNQGPVIGIFHEYAHLGKGSSIHVSGQVEWFHTQIHECSKIVDDQHHNVALEGNIIKISIDSGLACIHPVQTPSHHDLQTLSHVIFTSPQKWDHIVLDHRLTQNSSRNRFFF